MRVLGIKARKLANIPQRHRPRVFQKQSVEMTVEGVMNEFNVDEAVEKVEEILEESVKTEPVKKPRTRKPKVSVKEVTEAVEENNEEKSEE